MSLTKKVLDGVWADMAEYYGERWFKEYGPEPANCWIKVLDRFDYTTIMAAFEELKTRSPNFAPTLPQFELALNSAKHAHRNDGTDFVRAYWRTAVVDAVIREGNRLERWNLDAKTFPRLLEQNRETLGASMRELIKHLCDCERSQGKRTEALDDILRDRAKQIALEFVPQRNLLAS